MTRFFLGLFIVCAGTLTYEVLLTRLLGVITWYYLAFVSISMAMLGMTVGALMVHLYPEHFTEEQVPKRMAHASYAMAVSVPLALMAGLAVPVEFGLPAETLISFLFFSAIIAVPFFFSGVTVCLSLTKTRFSISRVYFVDLMGAAAGCFAALGLLKLIDAPSAIFVVSGLLFFGAAFYASFAGETRRLKRSLLYGVILLAVAAANSTTLDGIQPVWTKGSRQFHGNVLTEVWSPIYQVRVYRPTIGPPAIWGPSPRMPDFQVESMRLTIDGQTGTYVYPYRGDPNAFGFLRYDITSIGAPLRAGGSAAVIGVGGGRDVLHLLAYRYHRIVGIELNPAMVDLVSRKLDWFSGFSKMPGFELYADEGRSFLSRGTEKFDLIQAAVTDSWAAASAGSMSLSENSLYTVESMRTLYQRLRPGGVISFSRWRAGTEEFQAYRLFSVAWAALLEEGISKPSDRLVLLGSPKMATLLLCNRPFTPEELQQLRTESEALEFEMLFFPGQEVKSPELRLIAAAKTPRDLAKLRLSGKYDYSPTYDASPFFFNGLRIRGVGTLIDALQEGGHARGTGVLLCFLFSATILVGITVLVPFRRHWKTTEHDRAEVSAGLAYFIALGLAFMLVEIGMMQQLSILLGNPIYSLVVVLAGLIFSSGLGSLASGAFRFSTAVASRLPTLAAALVVVLYTTLVRAVTYQFIPHVLWQRMLLCLVLIAPCGFSMGFCFPVGLRWMSRINQNRNLPWMWALNGAAGVLATFIAVILSMETSTRTCVLAGAACYLLASAVLPGGKRRLAATSEGASAMVNT